jgi:hypothetical protein
MMKKEKRKEIKEEVKKEVKEKFGPIVFQIRSVAWCFFGLG